MSTKLLSKQLRKSLERLEDGRMWAHGEKNLRRGKCCAWTTQESMESARFFADVLGFDGHAQVFAWNDAPERTWAEVKKAFKTAIAVAEMAERQ